jgi:hypothetical protein
MRHLVQLILFLCILVKCKLTNAQSGCTDYQALNYTISATTNDGSCIYDSSYIVPNFISNLDNSLTEISGQQYYKHRLISINDGANGALIKILDTIGNIQQTCTISNGTNGDWEAITQSNSFFYIGDFGNNVGTRQDLRIYSLAKDSVYNNQANVSMQHFRFNNQLSYQVDAQTNFDCEAFINVQDTLYLFSKNWGNAKTNVYKLAPTDSIAYLQDSFNVRGLITDADYNTTSKRITLLGYDSTGRSFAWLLWDYKGNNFFNGHKRRIDFDYATLQNEGICFADSNRLFITSEGVSVVKPRLFSLDRRNFWQNNVDNTEHLLNKNEISIHHNYASWPITANARLMNLNGHVIAQCSNCEQLDFTNCAKGLYYIQLSFKNEVLIKKVWIN